ncbi:MAG: SAM-dependent methyltransferase [Candidatus Binatia bacterium]
MKLRWLLALALTLPVLRAGADLFRTGNGEPSLVRAQDGGLESKKIVPFVPTPQEVVEGMLQLAQVKKGDTVYDLGSGDGRIVITAAKKYGARAMGFEIDPELIKQSRASINKEGLEKLAEIREQDILTVDLSSASVLTMYLLPSVNLKLKPKILSEMKPGSRVVSHGFDMGDWKPDKTVQIDGRTVYLWTVPAKSSSKK